MRTIAVYLTSAGIGANLKQSATARDTIMFTMTAAMAPQSFQVDFELMFKGGSSKNDKCLCVTAMEMTCLVSSVDDFENRERPILISS